MARRHIAAGGRRSHVGTRVSDHGHGADPDEQFLQEILADAQELYKRDHAWYAGNSAGDVHQRQLAVLEAAVGQRTEVPSALICDEIALIVTEWAGAIVHTKWFIFTGHSYGSNDVQDIHFAQWRLNTLANVLGRDVVNQLVAIVREEFGRQLGPEYQKYWQIFAHGTPEEREAVREEVYAVTTADIDRQRAAVDRAERRSRAGKQTSTSGDTSEQVIASERRMRKIRRKTRTPSRG